MLEAAQGRGLYGRGLPADGEEPLLPEAIGYPVWGAAQSQAQGLSSKLQQKIIHLARAGIHREAISKRCGIGIGSVEQVISSEPGLVARRKRCHWESKRRRCRLSIARYQQRHPNAIRRDVKTACNSAFFWLYQYDRDWLNSILPKASKPIGFGKYKF